ncbi:hypothetical protein ACVDG3_15130 [Meridianimarinicoccus sp. RP-17]|uniref:hypothetical protein n=1 Tax=Meridianimarinicoccus zhengii TaxID=2056810 RepID=UPI000DAEF6A5|nr:hypothetical protein [Phycocomes zhengii]
MNDAPNPPDQTPEPLYLGVEAPASHGREIGLRAGDLVTAVNGIPVHGTEDNFRDRFGKDHARACALNVLRGERGFIVLAAHPDLGRLVPVTPTAAQLRDIARNVTGRLYPNRMVNWEVYRNRAGQYDLQPLTPSLLALVAAPLWLVQMRLWAALAMLVGVVVIAIPAGAIMAAIIYGLASIYVWRAGPAMFRADRRAAGLKPHAVIAAANERGAHRGFAELDPRARFVYEPPAQTAGSEDIAPPLDAAGTPAS